MPDRVALVRDTVRRLDTAGLRSSVLREVPDTMLEDLGLRLTDPRAEIREAAAWLEEQGVAASRAGVYRFASHFRRIYDQVRAEHARRLAQLTVDAPGTAAATRALTAAGQHRIVELATAKLLEISDWDELKGGDKNAVMLAVKFAQEAGVDADKLALARQDAETRAAKAEAELAVLRQRLDRLPDQVKALQKRLDSLSKAAKQGRPLDAKILAALREELLALTPAPAPAPGSQAPEAPERPGGAP